MSNNELLPDKSQGIVMVIVLSVIRSQVSGTHFRLQSASHFPYKKSFIEKKHGKPPLCKIIPSFLLVHLADMSGDGMEATERGVVRWTGMELSLIHI